MKLLLAAAALSLLATPPAARALELREKQSSPYDLAVTGLRAGVSPGETRYIPWADIRALPTTKLRVDGEFVKGPQELTVAFLSDLWAGLPKAAGADALFATCGDGYAGIYTSDFILRYRPFIVLEINGKGPADWPPPGLKFNPGPYVITVSQDLVPEAARFLDIEHKKPWGVQRIEVANFAESFKGIYSGRWAGLEGPAAAGREIWINSCASCHPGPGSTFGGTKSGRPFPVIAAYAAYDSPFFMQYVRDPKSLVASAKMEAHPRYTDLQMGELMAFITLGACPSP